MDLTLNAEERAFRDEVATWLAENAPRERRPYAGQEMVDFDQAWQRRQFEGGWAGISWPAEYGGRGLSLVQQVIWFEEYARAGAPAETGVCFVGQRSRRPDADRVRHRGAEARHLPRDPRRRGDLVPGLLRARRRLRPGRAVRPAPSSTATTWSSTARRSGPATPTIAD